MEDVIELSSPTSPVFATKKEKNFHALEELFLDTPTRKSRPFAAVVPQMVRIYSDSSEISEDWPHIRPRTIS